MVESQIEVENVFIFWYKEFGTHSMSFVTNALAQKKNQQEKALDGFLEDGRHIIYKANKKTKSLPWGLKTMY